MYAFSRNQDGTLDLTPLMVLESGEINLGHHYNPVTLIPNGTEKLMGWGKHDGEAAVYINEISGREVIVPEQYRKRIEQAIKGKP